MYTAHVPACTPKLCLVCEVAFAADNVVGDGVRCLGGVRTKLVLEAVRRILRVASMVGIDTHLAVEVQRREGAGHEGAVHGNLM